MSYSRMTFAERMDLFRLFHAGKLNQTQIARKLNRSVSGISRELSRGSDSGAYNPFISEMLHLNARRHQCPQLKVPGKTWNLIKPKLELRRSPEEIARWLAAEYPEYTVSGKTIYNYVHFHMKGELKKLALSELRQRGKSRKKREQGDNRGKIPGMTLIDERSEEVTGREVPGHWEGDLIIGKGHKSAICVTVERKTRYIQMDLLTGYDARTVRKTIEKRFKRLAPALRKSLTLDQGKENSEHKKLAENLRTGVYFCHPHSPWEKGTCENTNFLIRDMLYPVDDFRQLTQRDVSRIARLLNERPRKTLDFKTPKEVFLDLR
jgi:IS30 family transposase